MVQSVSGGGHNGGGVFINSEDHARFGLLYLNNGFGMVKGLFRGMIKKSVTSSSTNPEYAICGG